MVEVRREMGPLIEYTDDKTESKKEERKKNLLKHKKVLKTKRNLAVTEAQKACELFRCFINGESRMQWDKIVHEMHSKDP